VTSLIIFSSCRFPLFLSFLRSLRPLPLLDIKFMYINPCINYTIRYDSQVNRFPLSLYVFPRKPLAFLHLEPTLGETAFILSYPSHFGVNVHVVNTTFYTIPLPPAHVSRGRQSTSARTQPLVPLSDRTLRSRSTPSTTATRHPRIPFVLSRSDLRFTR